MVLTGTTIYLLITLAISLIVFILFHINDWKMSKTILFGYSFAASLFWFPLLIVCVWGVIKATRDD